MPKPLPDQSFYPSPTMAMQAPAETLAYVALLNPDPTASDALAVLNLDRASPGYGTQIARVDMPGAGDELHHFGWNACSSCLCPNSPHAHMQRRYLVAGSSSCDSSAASRLRRRPKRWAVDVEALDEASGWPPWIPSSAFHPRPFARTPTSRAANRRACSSRRELVAQPRL